MPYRERVLTIPGDSHSIPATYVVPVNRESSSPAKCPAALLLHGTASRRDEVAGMYSRLANELAEHGIASLRIDFAGCGDSDCPQSQCTITSEVEDAQTALAWLQSQAETDPRRIYLVGFSQGGMIAILVARQTPDIAGLASWSSGVIPATDREAGFASLFEGGEDTATLDMGFTTFTFSRTWFDEFRSADLTVCQNYSMPVLAICGSADVTVDPAASYELIRSVKSDDRTLIQLPKANHIFNALSEGDSSSEMVIRYTQEWMTQRAFAPAPASVATESGDNARSNH